MHPTQLPMRTGLALLSSIFLATFYTAAQSELEITSFRGNGELTFNKITNAASYRVEWAASLSTNTPWTNFAAAAAALDNIVSPGTGTVTVAVPMFYRVVATLQSYDLVISEVMYDPSVVPDSTGEWFEIYNRAPYSVDLNGLRIASGAESHVISNATPLVVAAGGYIVLGNSIDPSANGNTPVSYRYAGITLANISDSIALYDGANLIDAVAYDETAGYPSATGASIYLKSNALSQTANDVASNWALSTATFGSGDRGTPGAANE
jgi:hypothetical protein